MNTLNNKFIGAAKKVSYDDLVKVAQYLNVEVASLQAVIEVEAAGSGFYPIGAPTMLYEPHIAYRLSTGIVKSELIKAGLAYYRWGTKPYPKSYVDRYAQLEKAISIAGPIAYEFASYGLPQMMGFNYKVCGFSSAEELFNAFKDSELNQLFAMAGFIKANISMHKALMTKDWAGFALRYNGKGYKTNKYDTKLATAYNKYKKNSNSIPSATGTFVIGSKGIEVKELQEALNRLGFGPIYNDGQFGKITLQSVQAYLKSKNLPIVDNVVISLQKAIIKEAETIALNSVIETVPPTIIQDTDQNLQHLPNVYVQPDVPKQEENVVEKQSFWQWLISKIAWWK